MRTPRILPGLVALILLAACSDDASPEDARASAERDVAMVEAANRAQDVRQRLSDLLPGYTPTLATASAAARVVPYPDGF